MRYSGRYGRTHRRTTLLRGNNVAPALGTTGSEKTGSFSGIIPYWPTLSPQHFWPKFKPHISSILGEEVQTPVLDTFIYGFLDL